MEHSEKIKEYGNVTMYDGTILAPDDQDRKTVIIDNPRIGKIELNFVFCDFWGFIPVYSGNGHFCLVNEKKTLISDLLGKKINMTTGANGYNNILTYIYHFVNL